MFPKTWTCSDLDFKIIWMNEEIKADEISNTIYPGLVINQTAAA